MMRESYSKIISRVLTLSCVTVTALGLTWMVLSQDGSLFSR
jgi:hypothetical protein